MDSLAGIIRECFLPNAASDSIELRFITLYLATTITLIIALGISQAISAATTTTTTTTATASQLPTLIDIYIDFNHYYYQQQQQQHSVSFFLSKLGSIIKQQQQQQTLKLVFWCYINTQLSQLKQWISQLEELQSDHSPHRFVHLIDTSDPLLSNRKPLLNDLLKIINISPPHRRYLISTSDPDLYTAGLQLVKQHPNTPILLYVPPYRAPLPDSIVAADHLFRWEKDDTLQAVNPIHPQEPTISHSGQPTHLHDKFKPLILLFNAHAQTVLPLVFIKNYLKPWFINPSSQIDSDLVLDQKMTEYIDSAVAHHLISLSTSSEPIQTEDDQTHHTIIVELQSRLSSDPGPSNRDDLSTDRLYGDEDSLTTTGSEIEKQSTSTRSSPSNRSQPSDDPACLSHHQALGSIDGHSRAENELLIKHKHPSSALDTDPVPNDRATKKKKSMAVFCPGPRLSPKSRVGSGSSSKRKSPIKSTHLPGRSASFTGIKGPSSLIQLDISRKNQADPVADHDKPHDFNFRSDGNLQTAGLDLVLRHHNRAANDRPRSNSTLEIRSCLWINCSTGLITNLLPFVRLTLPNGHPHLSAAAARKQAHQELTLATHSLSSLHFSSDTHPQNHPPSWPPAGHLHFNHTILPALLLLSSSAHSHPPHLLFPIPFFHHHRHHHLGPQDQSSSAPSSSVFSELDDID